MACSKLQQWKMFSKSNQGSKRSTLAPGQLPYISSDDGALWNMLIKQRLTELLRSSLYKRKPQNFILERTEFVQMHLTTSRWGGRWKQKPFQRKAWLTKCLERSAKCFLRWSVNASLHDIRQCAIFIIEYHYCAAGRVFLFALRAHTTWYALSSPVTVHYVPTLNVLCAFVLWSMLS